MRTVHKHKLGIYQITAISPDDAFYSYNNDLIGMNFIFPSVFSLYTYPDSPWIGIGEGIKLIVHKEHPNYNFLVTAFNFYAFKYKRVI